MNALMEYLRMNAGELLNFWLTMQLQTAAFVLLLLLVERALPLRLASPRFRYLLWTTALIKAFVPPVISLPGTDSLPVITKFLAPVTAIGASSASSSATPFSLELLLLLAILTSSLLLAGIAVWRAIGLRPMLRGAQPFDAVPPGDWPPILISEHIPSPLAAGILYPRIYITPMIAQAPREILLAVLQHEHAHIRRNDAAMVMVQTLVQIVYVLNPFVWIANLRLFRYREQICDDEALLLAGTRPQDYGRLLLRFAENQPARILQTGTCFFETRRGFVQRITELFNTRQHAIMKWKHYAFIIAFSLIMLPLSWRCGDKVKYSETWVEYPDSTTGEDLHADTASAALDYPIKTRMEYEQQGKMKTMEGPRVRGGFQELSKHVVYPKEAVRKGLEGTVIVETDIDEDGRVADCRVVKSVHPLLDAAALHAVKSVSFIPGQRNGKPLEATISIPIKFRLK
ncbi:MAG: TonB family protein [Bacteroidota bacterium]|jgi:TonB family protein